MSQEEGIQVARLARVEPTDVWRHEAYDFTRWLAVNLDALGKVLGVDLELERIEARVGDFAADIVARETGSNRRVVIENQLAPTDHRHLGQLLTYAAGTEAALIVWISPDFRDEHRQALDWLNQRTGEGVDFFGVALQVVRIDESRPAISLQLVSSPNAWSKRTKKILGGSTPLSEAQRRYQAFFDLLLDDLRKESFTNARQGSATNWQGIPTGVAGVIYTVCFARNGRLRTEIYIDTGDRARNKATFDVLAASRMDIESTLGRSLEWDRLDEKQASRITDRRPGAGLGVEADSELRLWVLESLRQLRATVTPRLRDALRAADQALAAPSGDEGGPEAD